MKYLAKEGARKNTGKPWSLHDLYLLQRLFPTYPWDELERVLGRSQSAIAAMAKRLRCRRATPLLAKTGPIRTDDHLMKRLRDIRLSKGMAAKTLATQIGKADRYVAMCERGEGNPGYEYLTKWCQALDLRLTVEHIKFKSEKRAA